MRLAALLLLLTLAVSASVARDLDAQQNQTSDEASHPQENDDEHEPIVRKKRTFGDIVFRGLADVLGYNVIRKPTIFPPPLAPVAGVDFPLQAATAAQAGAAPAVPVAPPCAAGRAVSPAPCRAQLPPPAAVPCAKPRAAPRPKPVQPAAPAPCASPRANPATAAPCAAAIAQPASPEPQKEERITSNFRLNFDFNRIPVQPTVASEAPEQLQSTQSPPLAFVTIAPRAAQLPSPGDEPQRKPRVYVDAFVVRRNGQRQKVDTADAAELDSPRQYDDYVAYDDASEEQPPAYDDYEDVQESRNANKKAMRAFGTALDKFWEQKKQKPSYHYYDVHFADKNGGRQAQNEGEPYQRLQQSDARNNNIPTERKRTFNSRGSDEEAEVTTTTEDPRKPLVPRVLPPTEHHPNQIDTVTVRVPPIYKEKKPRKLNNGPTRPDRDHSSEEDGYFESNIPDARDEENVQPSYYRRQRKRIPRSTNSDAYYAGDYDYYGNKLPISEEESYYRGLTIPPPTVDEDLARAEASEIRSMDDKERLIEDPERVQEDPEYSSNDPEISEDVERADEDERADNSGRADERERTDRLGPNARIHESGYINNYARATSVKMDDPNPHPASIRYRIPNT